MVLSFSGIIQRVDAENLLIGESTGSFLVRVSGRVWGYTISYRAVDRCKHFLVDTSDDGYQFFGTNQIKHATLSDLVLFHVVRIIFNRGICCRDLIIVWFHLSMQSLPISIKVLELEVYFISIDWSYGSWIYNYLCNQCLSPLKLWVRYNIMWSSLSVTCDRSMVFSGYSSFLHQWNRLPRYNWNIVESGAKHHNPNTNRIIGFHLSLPRGLSWNFILFPLIDWLIVVYLLFTLFQLLIIHDKTCMLKLLSYNIISVFESSPLKPLVQMNRNLVGSIYGRSSINIARSINKHGHHRQFLFLIGQFNKKSSPLKPLGQINQNFVGSIYGRSSIKIAQISSWSINKHGNSCFWLVNFNKSSPLKLLGQVNQN